MDKIDAGDVIANAIGIPIGIVVVLGFVGVFLYVVGFGLKFLFSLIGG